MLINIHSHRSAEHWDTLTVRNIEADEALSFNNFLLQASPRDYFSVGIHPWKAASWTTNALALLEKVASAPEVALLGEMGLDKVCKTSYSVQKKVFHAQLALADRLGKSVVLHVVKSMEDVLPIRRMYPNIPAMIVHGFRGKSQEAAQWIQWGFSLSYGLHFHTEAVRACPLPQLYVETDESDAEIRLMYSSISKALEIPEDTLEMQLEKNWWSLTKKRAVPE